MDGYKGRGVMIHPDFPYSQINPFEVTSDETGDYNCIAWAAKDQSKWYEPDPLGIFHWPKGVPRDYSVKSLIKLYESLGYKKCSSGDFEDGFDKVAIYSNSGRGTHAARQLDNSNWTSKLGKGHDVSHPLDSLNNSHYGTIEQFMKKPKN